MGDKIYMFKNGIIINIKNMAMSLNRVQLIGNLTRDPELKQIPSGQMVCSFGIATNYTYNDSSGEKQTKTEFHNIVAWGKLADICGQYLKKGQKIFCEGRMQTRDWEGEDGVKRSRTEVNLDNMIMLGGKGDASSFDGGAREARGISENKSETSETVNADSDEVAIEDLPF
jgi:single-strand DNA-binding protein